ncbi:myelin expression factor 2-like isoform X2 [Actinia tenebrosa]|uniref:Myelin expression factor 2-like isoform X2 n=1 Tax=Actinia tenebrosa TaxID=6105 RepID=A0A6P8I7E7_ACTTE|nr:myelin expression factor 2-like isoform X2 [Actinia tenebrosa]
MADQTTEHQLPLGMTYSTAYSLGIEATPTYTATNDTETREQREESKDSDQEESEGRRRGGFERDLRSDRENRRFTPYSTSRSKGRVSSSALKDYRVYVSNIPYNVRWQDLKDYMKKVGEVSFVEIFEDEKGRSKGCGVVEFREKEDAQKAITQYNGQDFQGRPLQVREDRVEEDSRMHRSRLRGNTIAQSSQQTTSNALQGLQGLPGLGGLPALLGLGNTGSMANKNDPSACTVFVSNLDFRVNWQKLKDAFKAAGNVVRANVKEDDNHKSKGYGTVQFETPTEAMNAVMLLNGQMIMDRTVTVRMDRNATQGGSRGSSQASVNPLAATGSQVAILNLLQSLQGLTALAQLGNLGGNLGNTNLGNLGNLGSTTANQSYGGMSAMPSTSSAGSASAMGMDTANLAALSNLSGMMNQLGSTTATSNYGTTNYGTTSYGMGVGGSTQSDSSSGKQIFVRNI